MRRRLYFTKSCWCCFYLQMFLFVGVSPMSLRPLEPKMVVKRLFAEPCKPKTKLRPAPPTRSFDLRNCRSSVCLTGLHRMACRSKKAYGWPSNAQWSHSSQTMGGKNSAIGKNGEKGGAVWGSRRLCFLHLSWWASGVEKEQKGYLPSVVPHLCGGTSEVRQPLSSGRIARHSVVHRTTRRPAAVVLFLDRAGLFFLSSLGPPPSLPLIMLPE